MFFRCRSNLKSQTCYIITAWHLFPLLPIQNLVLLKYYKVTCLQSYTSIYSYSDSRCTHCKYRAKTGNNISKFTHSNWITCVFCTLEVEFEFTTWALVQATTGMAMGGGCFYLYLNVYIYILFISKRLWGHYGELISVKIQ